MPEVIYHKIFRSKAFLKFIFSFLFVFLDLGLCLARVPIHDFKLSPALFENNSIHIKALNEAGDEDILVNGRYTFSVNGFEKRLLFLGGSAEYPDNLTSSTFLYMKCGPVDRPVSRLFYVYRTATGLSPFKISLFWLLVVPVILILGSFVFKRLIILAFIVILLFFLFNKGLSVSSYLSAVKDWIHLHI